MYPSERNAQTVYLQACDLLNGGDWKRSQSLADSMLAENKQVPFAQFLYYQFKTAYCNKKEDTENDLLYADSAIAVLENNKLEFVFHREYLHMLLEKGQGLTLMENYEEAYDYFLRAKQVAGLNLDSCSQNEYSHLVALALYKEGKYRDAARHFMDSYKEAMRCTENDRPYYRMQELLGNTALCYAHLGMPDSALHFYRSALLYIQQNGKRFGAAKMGEIAIGVIYGNMASVFTSIGSLDSAEYLQQKSIAINEQHGYENRDAQLVKIALAGTYLSKKDYLRAFQTLTAIQRNYESAPSLQSARELNLLFSKYYDAISNRDSAFSYYKTYILYRDSMTNKVEKRLKTGIVNQINSRDQKFQIELLKKDNQLSKLYLLVTAGFFLIAIIIIALVYTNFRKSRRQKEALEKSNREKDRILNVVAHDLRSPVGGVAYLADMMLMDSEFSMPAVEAFEMIKNSSQLSLQLINELMGFSQDEKRNIEKVPTDLATIVKDCKLMLDYKAREKAQYLQLALPDDPVFANIDREKICRVINNLIGNAIKFSKEGAEIIVTVSKQPDGVQLTVKDNGIGIPPELLPGLFELFTTSKRKGTAGEKSFGLGLAICKQIVEAHGGEISVQSKEGQGSSFYVKFAAWES